MGIEAVAIVVIVAIFLGVLVKESYAFKTYCNIPPEPESVLLLREYGERMAKLIESLEGWQDVDMNEVFRAFHEGAKLIAGDIINKHKIAS